jgi:hypothetical protein
MNTNRKRFAFLATTTAAVLVGGGVAVAYWTTTGHATGSANVGTSTALTVAQIGTPGGLVPGGPAQDVDFSVTNPSAGNQQLNDVTLSVAVATAPGTCADNNFAVTQPDVGGPRTMTPGQILTFNGATSGASVRMVDTGSNQDGCKGATLTLTYDAS